MQRALARLPAAPERAYDDDYAARTGRYAGILHEVRWGYYRGWLHGQVRRALVRKRWFQVVVRTRATALLVRIQDDGTVGFGRIAVLDLEAGTTRFAEAAAGAPLRTLVAGFMAGEGTDAFLRADGLDLALTRPVGRSAWHLRARCKRLELDLELDTADAPSPLLTIGAAAPPFTHRPGLTQRAPLLAVRGTADLDGPLDLTDATAEVTYANAFLAPETQVHLASAAGRLADGRRVALALADGQLHASCPEAALVLDEGAFALPQATMRQVGPTLTWQDPGGHLELTFTPKAIHAAALPRRPLRGAQAQRWLFGTFDGAVPAPDGERAEVTGLPGLCETHAWG